MSGQVTGFNPSQSHFRAGVQLCEGIPAADSAMTLHFELVGETLSATSAPIVDTTITGDADPALPLVGNVDIAGELTFVCRGEGFNRFYAAAFGNGDTPVALPASGAFQHLLSAATSDEAFPELLTIEINRDDGFPVRFWDCRVSSLVWTATDNGLFTCVMGIIAGRNGYHQEGQRLTAADAGTGQMEKRGKNPLSTWSNLLPARNSVVLEFVTLDAVAQTATVLAKWGTASPLTGTATTDGSTAVIVFTAGDLLRELQVGDLVTIGTDFPASAPAEVLTVDSADQFTATAVSTVAEAGEIAQKTFGATTTALLTGLEATKKTPQWNVLTDSETGLNMGRERIGVGADARVENIEAYVDLDGMTTADIALTGTVTTGAASTTLTGTATAFLTDLAAGMLVSIAGESDVRVESIFSDTIATLQNDPAMVGVGPVAATVRAQVEMPSQRPVWVESIPDVPPFPQNFIQVTAGAETYNPTTASVSFTPAAIALPGLGSRYSTVRDIGQNAVEVSFTHAKKDVQIVRAIEAAGVFQVTILAESGKAFIAGEDQEHTLLLVANGRAAGATYTVSAADATDETFTATGGKNPAEPTFTSALTTVIESSEATL